MPRHSLLVVLVPAVLLTAGCPSGAPTVERGTPPPPAEPTGAAAVAPCARAPRFHDPSNVAALPPRAGKFCLDPSGSDKGYGEGAKATLKPGICDVFDGECEIYVEHGALRVNEARYVDEGGAKATIDVKHSRFGSPEQAFAMFTKRAIGGSDPAHPDSPRPIPGGGRATLGLGNAYVWRGSELAEITLNDADLSVEQLKKRGDELLPGLVAELGAKLAGPIELPPSAKLLPEVARLPNGVRTELANVLVSGGGPGAYGYYRDGEKRWRVLAVAAPSEDEAKKVLAKLGEGGTAEKGLGDAATRTLIGPTKSEWLLARRGATVLGVGDETLVLRAGMPTEEREKRTLSREEKSARLADYLEKATSSAPQPTK